MLRRFWILSLLVAFGILASSCRPRLNLPFGLIVNFSGFQGDPIAEPVLNRRIRLPEGFSINTYASGLRSARMLRFTDTGDLLVSSSRDDKVYLVERDADGDGYSDGTSVLLPKVNQPHGLVVHEGWLYVAEGDAIARVKFDSQTRRIDGELQRFITNLPSGGNHWTRTIGIGPDGFLYVSIGSSCNVCLEEDSRRAAISRFPLDGGPGTIYASGLRNSVGFAWRPGTNELYATDNGRDLLGDDFPPCELNRIVEGGFYGWPLVDGFGVPDPDFGTSDPGRAKTAISPVHGFGAHTAPLGIAFYIGAQFPERYHGAAFVALHGSWNRSSKAGYKVVALQFAADGSIREEDFAVGFENDDDVIGRPVDAAVGPDGSLYVSDDYAGSIYRIAYNAPAHRRDASVAAVEPAGTKLASLDPGERETATARGHALWDQHPCRTCHEGIGGAPAQKPLLDLGKKYTIESLTTFLRTPQPPMPVFPLTDEQRRDLSIYLLATHP